MEQRKFEFKIDQHFMFEEEDEFFIQGNSFTTIFYSNSQEFKF